MGLGGPSPRSLEKQVSAGLRVENTLKAVYREL